MKTYPYKVESQVIIYKLRFVYAKATNSLMVKKNFKRTKETKIKSWETGFIVVCSSNKYYGMYRRENSFQIWQNFFFFFDI